MRRSATGNRESIRKSARIAVAERDDSGLSSISPVTLVTAIAGTVLLLLILMSPFAANAGQEPPTAPPAALMTGTDPIVPRRVQALETLLVVPTRHDHRSDAEIADAEIAAAVERGTNPELVKKSAFRKKNLDLFRTEREVEIGEQEMLLRLRLRAKSRETMSVELRF